MKKILTIITIFITSTIQSETYVVKIESKMISNLKVEISYNNEGYNSNGIHKDTGTKYNNEGYDVEGYDINGLSKKECKYSYNDPSSFIMYESTSVANTRQYNYHIQWENSLIKKTNMRYVDLENWNARTVAPQTINGYTYSHNEVLLYNDTTSLSHINGFRKYYEICRQKNK